jgi:hypothetical protein
MGLQLQWVREGMVRHSMKLKTNFYNYQTEWTNIIMDAVSIADSFSTNRSFDSSSTNRTPITPRSRSVSVDYFGVTETVMQAVQSLESIAIPHFKSLVQSTKRSVTHLANAARLDNTLPRDELPLHLYSGHLRDSSDLSSIFDRMRWMTYLHSFSAIPARQI